MLLKGCLGDKKRLWTRIITSLLSVTFLMIAIVKFRVPPKIKTLALDGANEYGLDASLVLAVIKCESGFDADAVSVKGACGLMQLTPSTYDYITALFGIDGKIFDSAANVAAGCAYLRYLSDIFIGEKEILSAYNAGEGVVRRWLADKKYSTDGVTLKLIPYKETERYVRSVMIYYNFYKGIVNESRGSKSKKDYAVL